MELFTGHPRQAKAAFDGGVLLRESRWILDSADWRTRGLVLVLPWSCSSLPSNAASMGRF
jgi:hypothetical protein